MKALAALSACLPATPGIRGLPERHAVVMVLLSGSKPCVVFEERAAGIAQPGEIGFPGGMADPDVDPTPEATAFREASEELGIPVSSMRLIGRLDSLLTRAGMQVDVVVAHTDRLLSDMRPNAAEVARLFALPLDWLLAQHPQTHGVVVKSHPSRLHPVTGEEEVLLPAEALRLPERYHRPWGDAVVPVVAYDTPEGLIWGITGDILRDFLEKASCWQERFPGTLRPHDT